jgi:hypothetical protein
MESRKHALLLVVRSERVDGRAETLAITREEQRGQHESTVLLGVRGKRQWRRAQTAALTRDKNRCPA